MVGDGAVQEQSPQTPLATPNVVLAVHQAAFVLDEPPLGLGEVEAALEAMILDQEVIVQYARRDRYRRILATVHL